MFNYYDLNQEELVLGGKPATELAAAFGTPLYVYVGEVARRKYELVREHFPAFDVYYSLKANGSLALATLFRAWGAGAEIASGGELVLARSAGFSPERIIFAGPGKTEEELAAALQAGIFCFNAESTAELERLETLGRRLGRQAQVALRINTRETAAGAGEKMVGGPSKFGWDEERAVGELAGILPRLEALQVQGVHVYTGSQILTVEELVANARRTLAVAARLSRALSFPVRVLDFGGGFGVPYRPSQPELELAAVGRAYQRLLETEGKWLAATSPTLILELGRYLVAECGFYLTRVLEVKESRGERFLITDGGMNQWLRPVFMGETHPTFVANKLNQPPVARYQVGGPCCTPLDLIARDVELPEVAPGDLIAVGNAGAYGFSMSMLYFLGHPLPAEVLVWEGEARLVRRRGQEGDCLVNQLAWPQGAEG